MESPRITLARVLALGVRVTWREATAIVHEAVAATRAADAAGPARVTAASCLLTRGGDVVLTGPAAQARPEVVVRLLDDLLASCSDPGRFAGAVANGAALEMIEELSQHTTAKRRRVEVAAVALRGLVAAADAARAMADADQREPSAELDRVSATAPRNAALTLVASTPQGSRPGATLRPAVATDLLSATPQVKAGAAARVVAGGSPSRFGWVERVSPAALVGSVLAVAAGAILVLQFPAARQSAVAPSEPAIESRAVEAPVGLGGDTALARPDPPPPPEVTNPPPVPPGVARTTPRDSIIADASFDRAMPPPAGGPQTPAESTPAVARPGSVSTTSAADGSLPPAPANSVAADSPAVDLSRVVASPSTAAASTPETVGSATTDVPARPVAQSPGRETEARAIENVLSRYRSAFNALDAGAASAVWPTVNEKTLARAFERLESHDVSFEDCQIEIFSDLAEAACSGRARYVPKVGSRTPRDEARRWRFSLRKANDGWLIDRVDAR